MLTVEEFGTVAIFQTIAVGISACFSLGMHNSVTRIYFYDQKKNTYETAVSVSLFFFMFICISLLIIPYLFPNELKLYLGLDYNLAMLCILLAFSEYVYRLNLIDFQVRKIAKKYAFLQIALALSRAILTVFLVFIYQYGLYGRITALVIAAVIFAIVSVLFLLKRGALVFPTKKNVDSLKELMLLGLPLVPHLIFTYFITSIDRFFINDRLGVEILAIYMLAVQLSSVVKVLFDAINKAYLPILFENLKNGKPVLLKSIKDISIICIVILFPLFLLYPYLETVFKFIFGGEYSDSVLIFSVLVVAQLINGITQLANGYCLYKKKTGIMSVVTITSGVLNIAFLIYAVPNFGAIGAAFAFTLSCIVRFILTMTYIYYSNKKQVL